MPYKSVAATTNKPYRSILTPSELFENTINIDVPTNPTTKPIRSNSENSSNHLYDERKIFFLC